MPAKIPDICDYDCPHADFPPADTAGICRTMSAVWCKKLKELVNKNALCEWKQRATKKTAMKKAARKPIAAKQTRKTTRRRSP